MLNKKILERLAKIESVVSNDNTTLSELLDLESELSSIAWKGYKYNNLDPKISDRIGALLDEINGIVWMLIQDIEF